MWVLQITAHPPCPHILRRSCSGQTYEHELCSVSDPDLYPTIPSFLPNICRPRSSHSTWASAEPGKYPRLQHACATLTLSGKGELMQLMHQLSQVSASDPCMPTYAHTLRAQTGCVPQIPAFPAMSASNSFNPTSINRACILTQEGPARRNILMLSSLSLNWLSNQKINMKYLKSIYQPFICDLKLTKIKQQRPNQTSAQQR